MKPFYEETALKETFFIYRSKQSLSNRMERLYVAMPTSFLDRAFPQTFRIHLKYLSNNTIAFPSVKKKFRIIASKEIWFRQAKQNLILILKHF